MAKEAPRVGPLCHLPLSAASSFLSSARAYSTARGSAAISSLSRRRTFNIFYVSSKFFAQTASDNFEVPFSNSASSRNPTSTSLSNSRTTTGNNSDVYISCLTDLQRSPISSSVIGVSRIDLCHDSSADSSGSGSTSHLNPLLSSTSRNVFFIYPHHLEKKGTILSNSPNYLLLK